jgi:hypothetical protein
VSASVAVGPARGGHNRPAPSPQARPSAPACERSMVSASKASWLACDCWSCCWRAGRAGCRFRRSGVEGDAFEDGATRRGSGNTVPHPSERQVRANGDGGPDASRVYCPYRMMGSVLGSPGFPSGSYRNNRTCGLMSSRATTTNQEPTVSGLRPAEQSQLVRWQAKGVAEAQPYLCAHCRRQNGSIRNSAQGQIPESSGRIGRLTLLASAMRGWLLPGIAWADIT